MCGITGFLDLRSERTRNREIVVAMTQAIAHRGPNAEGLWQSPDGVVNLGHRRLSIIDLSPTGAQPMVSRDGRYVLIFNGEIYNFQELRETLEAEGNSFVGTSDTEVLLMALIRWGTQSTLVRLNGMFAFAFWDNRDRTLLLARIVLGKTALLRLAGGGVPLRIGTQGARPASLVPAGDRSGGPVAICPV